MKRLFKLNGGGVATFCAVVDLLVGNNLLGRFDLDKSVWFFVGFAVACFASFFYDLWTRAEEKATLRDLSDSARALLFELGKTNAHLFFAPPGLKIDQRRVPYQEAAGRELKAKGLLLSLGWGRFGSSSGDLVTGYCLSDKGAATYRAGVKKKLFDNVED